MAVRTSRGIAAVSRLRYAACRCSQRCTRVSSQTLTLNRIHGERSRCGRNTAPGASMMPSRCEASASVSESSTCGNRAQTNMPSAGSILVRLQQPADEPDQLFVALVVGGGGGMRGLHKRGGGRRVEAGPPARLQIAHRNQPIVGLNHREAADIVGRSEVPDGQQLGGAADGDPRSVV
jgi:hypothetical protein